MRIASAPGPGWRDPPTRLRACCRFWGQREKLVTCKTGAVFLGLLQYCGQQWRERRRQGEKREATVVISHAQGVPAGKHHQAPETPAPPPLLGCGSTQRHPVAQGSQRPVYLDTGVSAWSGSHAPRGSEALGANLWGSRWVFTNP